MMNWRQWGNIGETVVQEEKLCDEVETVGEYWRDSGGILERQWGNIGETVGEYWRYSGAG